MWLFYYTRTSAKKIKWCKIEPWSDGWNPTNATFGMVYGFALATLQTTSEIGRESVTSIQALDGALYDVPGMEEKQNSNRKQGVPPFRTRLDTDTWLLFKFTISATHGQTVRSCVLLQCCSTSLLLMFPHVSTFQTTVAVLAQCPSRERFGSCSLNGDIWWPGRAFDMWRISSHTAIKVDPSSYLYCRCGTLPSPTTARQGPEWSSQSNWPRPPRPSHQASRTRIGGFQRWKLKHVGTLNLRSPLRIL